MKSKVFIAAVLVFALFGFPQASGQTTSEVIPPQAKVFVAPMPDGFDEYLKAAFEKERCRSKSSAKRSRRTSR
jgi:hypothetical protein